MKKLTRSQVNHILALLMEERQDGSYYGNKAQHSDRLNRLIDMFEDAYYGHAVFVFKGQS